MKLPVFLERLTRPSLPPMICRMIFDEICVLANGDIVCSCHDSAGKQVYGNVYRDRIADVYNGSLCVWTYFRRILCLPFSSRLPPSSFSWYSVSIFPRLICLRYFFMWHMDVPSPRCTTSDRGQSCLSVYASVCPCVPGSTRLLASRVSCAGDDNHSSQLTWMSQPVRFPPAFVAYSNVCCPVSSRDG